jgi:hypothetical protein
VGTNTNPNVKNVVLSMEKNIMRKIKKLIIRICPNITLKIKTDTRLPMKFIEKKIGKKLIEGVLNILGRD